MGTHIDFYKSRTGESMRIINPDSSEGDNGLEYCKDLNN